MKKLLLLFLLFPALAAAQPFPDGNVSYFEGTVDPTGACIVGSEYYRTDTGGRWTCCDGTWCLYGGTPPGAPFACGTLGSPGIPFNGVGTGEMGILCSPDAGSTGTMVLQNYFDLGGTIPNLEGRSRLSLGLEFFSLQASRAEDFDDIGSMQCFDEGGGVMICRMGASEDGPGAVGQWTVREAYFDANRPIRTSPTDGFLFTDTHQLRFGTNRGIGHAGDNLVVGFDEGFSATDVRNFHEWDEFGQQFMVSTQDGVNDSTASLHIDARGQSPEFRIVLNELFNTTSGSRFANFRYDEVINQNRFDVYRTWTDANNNEGFRVWMSQTAGQDINLIAQTVGTGTDDIDINLMAAGDGQVRAGSTIRFLACNHSDNCQVNTLGIREWWEDTPTTLTESTATPLFNVSTVGIDHQGFTVKWTVTADDGSDFQTRRGSTYVALAQTGLDVDFCGVSDVGTSAVAVSAGTLTVSTSCDTTPVNTVDFELNATSSLTQTTLEATWSIEGDVAASVSPQ